MRNSFYSSTEKKSRVFQIETGSFWLTKTHPSSALTRIIWEDANGSYILESENGSVKSGGLTRVVGVWGLDTGMQTHPFQFSSGLLSKDGQEVELAVDMTARVAKDDKKIQRVFSDELTGKYNEMEVFAASLFIYVQRFITEKSAAALRNSSRDFTNYLQEEKENITSSADSGYEAISFSIKNISLKDKGLETLLSQTTVEVEKEKHNSIVAKAKLKTSDSEFKLTKRKKQREIVVDELDHVSARNKKQKDQQLDLKLEREHADLLLYVAKEKASLLKSLGGRLALTPELEYKYLEEVKKLELAQKRKEDETLMKYMSLTTENNVLSAVGSSNIELMKKILRVENFSVTQKNESENQNDAT